MLAHWWLADMSPIPGVVRAIFYGGLLVLCLVDHPSPLDAPRIIARTEPAFYTPVGILRVLGIRWVEPRVLSVVRAVTMVTWVAATVGFLQPVSAALTFLGFAFLHAVNAGTLGSNHSTHAALYALFCMSFSVSHDSLSLDRYLSTHAGWPLLVPPGSLLESGFAPKLLLVSMAYIMFAGGVSKLRNGGLAWSNGKALRFYIEQSTEHARAPQLARALVDRPLLCRILACLSVVVELSAPLVLVDAAFRLPLILAWVGFHLGILLVMMPAYWIQMWCYLLLVDWNQPLAVVTGGHHPSATMLSDSGPGAAVLTVLGFLYCAALLLVLVRQSEQWPFTSVPMYSNAIPPDELTPPTRDQLHARAAQVVGGRVSAWQRPWVSTEILEDIRLVPRDGEPPTALFDVMAEQDARFVRWSQYAKVVRAVAVADVAAKSADRLEEIGPDYPASRFLGTLVTFVRSGLPTWRQYERLELACRTSSGWLVIGRADLHEGAGHVSRTGAVPVAAERRERDD